MIGIPLTYLGSAAGVGASVSWTATSLFFTAAGRRIGAVRVNAIRIVLGIIMLAITHRLLSGAWVPEAMTRQIMLLALSGVIGLAIGDQALFSAFVMIGPRLSTLVMTASPLFAALLAWMFMNESIPWMSWLGIALTLAGVAWVVLERSDRRAATDSAKQQQYLRGIALAFLGGACQAAGLMLSKLGMGHGWLDEAQRMDPLPATLLRLVFAAVAIAPLVWFNQRREARLRARGNPVKRHGSPGTAYLLTAAGAVTGPFLGVWMSLIAVDLAPVGVAQTLCSLTPVFILPLAVYINKERVSPRAALGACLAVAGTAVLLARA